MNTFNTQNTQISYRDLIDKDGIRSVMDNIQFFEASEISSEKNDIISRIEKLENDVAQIKEMFKWRFED